VCESEPLSRLLLGEGLDEAHVQDERSCEAYELTGWIEVHPVKNAQVTGDGWSAGATVGWVVCYLMP
jgi:hypothetical protein